MAHADSYSMRPGPRIAFWPIAFLIATSACPCNANASDADPLRTLVGRIRATSRPESTAVLVVSDRVLLEGFLDLSRGAIAVFPIALPNDNPTAAQIGQVFRETSAATMNYTDVWVIGISTEPRTTRRVGAIAEMAARLSRIRVLRDSVRTSRGTVTFTLWADLPGGAARRAETRRALASADSVLAHGGPRPIPITRPFTRGELAVDPDTASWYAAHLADTSFYSIGGCSEVELVMWDASEKLGQMGPGIVPILVQRIADPNPFVRERVQDALMLATQDERILARTGGEYVKFYDQPNRAPRDIVDAWWAKFGHFWTPADSTR